MDFDLDAKRREAEANDQSWAERSAVDLEGLVGRTITSARMLTPSFGSGTALVLGLDDGRTVVVREHDDYAVSVEPYEEWAAQHRGPHSFLDGEA